MDTAKTHALKIIALIFGLAGILLSIVYALLSYRGSFFGIFNELFSDITITIIVGLIVIALIGLFFSAKKDWIPWFLMLSAVLIIIGIRRELLIPGIFFMISSLFFIIYQLKLGKPFKKFLPLIIISLAILVFWFFPKTIQTCDTSYTCNGLLITEKRSTLWLNRDDLTIENRAISTNSCVITLGNTHYCGLTTPCFGTDGMPFSCEVFKEERMKFIGNISSETKQKWYEDFGIEIDELKRVCEEFYRTNKPVHVNVKNMTILYGFLDRIKEDVSKNNECK